MTITTANAAEIRTPTFQLLILMFPYPSRVSLTLYREVRFIYRQSPLTPSLLRVLHASICCSEAMNLRANRGESDTNLILRQLVSYAILSHVPRGDAMYGDQLRRTRTWAHRAPSQNSWKLASSTAGALGPAIARVDCRLLIPLRTLNCDFAAPPLWIDFAGWRDAKVALSATPDCRAAPVACAFNASRSC